MPDFFTRTLNLSSKLVAQAASKLSQNHKPHIILGLSGGPDSVFLLYILAKLAELEVIELSAAHLDHGWRASSSKDADFCKKLCTDLNTPFYNAHASTISLNKSYKGSQEALGRALRQTFFKQILQTYNADFIALAHHYDDQQETFFIRLLRGSTIDGLCSMKPIDNKFIRPLLATRKKEILDYLDSNKILYCLDETNSSPAYLRNRIRSVLIPALNSCDARFDTTFQHTLTSLQTENNFLHELAEKTFNSVFVKTSTEKHLVGSRKVLLEQHPVMQHRILLLWIISESVAFSPSQAFIQEILTFLSNPRGGRHTLNLDWAIIKKQNNFWIELFPKRQNMENL